MGEAQILTNMGPLPINFEIDATNLADAVAKYGDAAKAGVEHAMRELQEMRRQQSSSLVIPQGGVPNLGGGGEDPAAVTGTREATAPRAGSAQSAVANRSTRKSVNTRTLADRWRRLGYTT